MFAEQGYFTRAGKSKFTGEAGYAVADASGGIDKPTSELFVQSIGETVVFDPKDGSDQWMYAVLPSRVDGRLSVTLAFPTNDGRRNCHFSHTLLFDENDAGKLLRDEMATAPVLRVTGFRDEYVGEPAGIGRMNVRFSGLPPCGDGGSGYDGGDGCGGYDGGDGDAALVDSAWAESAWAESGFDYDSIVKLLQTLVTLHENRGKKPNPINSVFVVYKCEPDEFRDKAFGLARLLYSRLPYIMTSKLGLIIKTDAARRKPESYPSGYRSAYAVNAVDKSYIPGGELFIFNTAPALSIGAGSVSGACADAALFTVDCVADRGDGNGAVRINNLIELNPAYLKFISLIASDISNATTDGPSEKLKEFYGFISGAFNDEISFRDMNGIYALTETLRNPAEAIGGGWKFILRTLRILNAVGARIRGEFAEPWRTMAQEFVEAVLIADVADPPDEDACVQTLEAGARLYRGKNDIRLFSAYFYRLLVKSQSLTRKNERLIVSLVNNREILTQIAGIDLSSPVHHFKGFRDELIAGGDISDISVMIEFFDVYDEIESVDRVLYELVDKLTSDKENRKNLADSIERERLGIVGRKIKFIYELKELNGADFENCNGYFTKRGHEIDAILGEYSLADAWLVKYYIFKIFNEADDDKIDDLFNALRTRLELIIKKDTSLDRASIKDYRDKLCSSADGEPPLEMPRRMLLIKYMDLNSVSPAILWHELIGDIAAAVEIDAFFQLAAKLSPYIQISDTEIYNIFIIIKKVFVEFAEKDKKDLLPIEGLMRNCYSIITEAGMPQGTNWRLLAAALYGFCLSCLMNESYGIFGDKFYTCYCKNCHAVMSINNFNAADKKSKCPLCGKPIFAAEKSGAASKICVIAADVPTALKLFSQMDGIHPDHREHREKDKDAVLTVNANTNDMIQINVKGYGREAIKLFGENLEKRWKYTCVILDTDAECVDEARYLQNLLENRRFSVVTTLGVDDAAAPAIFKFEEKRYTVSALVEYRKVNRPDNIILEIAQAALRHSILKAGGHKISANA